MKVALHDSEGGIKYPNLVLMKLSAWHKSQGDTVEWFKPLFTYDKVYSSKVFTFTKADPFLPADTVKGGTGYGMTGTLPDSIEHICPDYSLYGTDKSYGFLTRGCPNHCPWCIVPKKEGKIRAHADVEEFARHKQVVLMDNNVLACDHGLDQIDKMARLGLRVDFNQGLDARRIDEAVARRLASLKWIRYLRLACDQQSQMPAVEQAVNRLRRAGLHAEIFCYALIKDVDEALERVEFLRSLGVSPFCQPYRDFENKIEPTREQRLFARYVNLKKIFKTATWQEFLKYNCDNKKYRKLHKQNRGIVNVQLL